MRKRIVFIIAIACVLLITGCGDSNSAEDSAGADNPVYFTGEKGQFQEVQRILYWTDNGWTIISEEVLGTDADKDIECGLDFCL